jgi:hypothetical protein
MRFLTANCDRYLLLEKLDGRLGDGTVGIDSLPPFAAGEVSLL